MEGQMLDRELAANSDPAESACRLSDCVNDQPGLATKTSTLGPCPIQAEDSSCLDAVDPIAGTSRHGAERDGATAREQVGDERP